MPVLVCGTNYKTSPLWLREKAALSGISLFDTRKRILDFPEAEEVVVVSTCNRVEFYLAGPDEKSLCERMSGFVGSEYGLSPSESEEYFYIYSGRDAASHLFSVVVGADSMVAGEVQVLGQVQRCFEQARLEEALGPELSGLIESALGVAERVRTETAFSSSPVSVGSVAVSMARSQVGSLKNRAAMVLGAGEMGILTARALSANGVATILVANRTLSRAQEVAHKLGGRAVDYTELQAQIEKVDVLVTSTSAPHTLVKKPMIERVMEGRPKQHLFIVDLALPRDVHPEVMDVPGVSLVNVDDLQSVAEQNTRERLSELPRVSAIISEQARAFESKKRGLSLMDLALG